MIRTTRRRRPPLVQPLESRLLFSGAAQFVIHVSVDGLRPDAVTQLGAARLPNFYRLREQGAFTDNARTDYDYTITLPNHTTHVTGRYVVGEAGHNWTANTDPLPGQTLHSNKGSYVASAWDVAHDARLRTGLFASKTKFSLFDTSYDADSADLQGGALDTTGEDNGRDKIDHAVITETDSLSMTTAFLDAMSAQPFHYAMVHYHDPDTAGHATGWMQPDYFAAIEQVDAQLGRIFSLIGDSSALAGNTALIVTSDHGGEGAGHGDATDPEAYTIPFYVWGPGVTAGGDLYRMNSDSRMDPGTGRPDNAATPQPIRDGDVANLAMDLLGLGSVPGSAFNARQDLKIDVYSPPPPSSVTFQQNLNGYAGTVDTQVQQANPSTAYGAGTFIKVDTDEPAGTAQHSQGLVRFENIFGNGSGQIPAGSEITSARLDLQVYNAGHTVNLHRMLSGWSGTSTWNSLGSGVQADGVEALATADAGFTTGTTTGTYSIDVTASLSAWASDPATNLGWALLPTSTDGVEFYTSEGSVAPKLVVSYNPPANLPVVTVTASDGAAAEAGLDGGQFLISRTGDTTAELLVRFATGGTATADSDYVAPGSSVTIAAGQSSAVVNLSPLDDAVFEGDETVALILSADPAYSVGSAGSATVVIADDESPPPVVTVSASDATAAETGDTGTFTVSRTGDLAADLLVSYTVGGTATPDADYQSLTGTVTIPAGSSSAVFSIVPIDDTLYESNETVIVTLADGTAYDVGTPSAATVTITSEDAEPVAPAAPTELTGKAYNGGRIDLFWKDNSNNETSFVLEWSTDGRTWSTLATLAADTRTYTRTGLAKSTFYYFRVKAVNAYGSSAWSNVLKIRSAAR